MSSNLMCVKHPTRDAYCKVAYLGEFRCVECVRELGDFDEFGQLSKFSQKREDAKIAKAKQVSAPKPEPAKKASPPKDSQKSVQTEPKPVDAVQQASPSGEKKCSICGQIKQLDVFENDKRRPDGHGPRCKPCVKARAAAKRGAS